MRRFVWLVMVLIWIFATAACSWNRLVRDRASYDLKCPFDAVVAEDIGAGGWKAYGCGLEVSYVCTYVDRNAICTQQPDGVKKTALPTSQ